MDTFSSFFSDTRLSKSGKISPVLSEGIVHVEALPHDKFIRYLKSISQFNATEKLDGNNLTFGFDAKGRFYTSRESKKGKRFYSVSDYADRAANNGNKSVHVALKKMEPFIKSVMSDGEACEIEVLYGKQPNAIIYGSNYIAFLRMVLGDNKESPNQSKTKSLHTALKNKSVKSVVDVVSTSDGIRIEKKRMSHDWKFSTVSRIAKERIGSVNVSEEITAFEKWLKEKHESGYTHGDLLEIKLTSIPKANREEIKQARQSAIEIAEKKFKLPIKEKFISSLLRDVKPTLRDLEVNPSEDFGIEGAVFQHGETEERFKIVDKNTFTMINAFNHAIRNEVKSGVRGRKKFDKATIGVNTDIFNEMLSEIADAIGIPTLGHLSGIKRILKKYQGETEKETITNLAGSIQSTNAIPKIEKALSRALTKLSKGLAKYKLTWKEMKTTLPTGKEIKYTWEIHKRTLMVFAEVRKEISDLSEKVNKSKSLNEVILAIYGEKIKEIHSES